ncbi:MAG: thioredoxin-disulfide reductase [Candidatus Omnitrophica bacterium]|nr:thioredoxin-disulfide reductase [Candidatus Omnitrophota bacterium]MBU1853857.1 thioredoxin-disulfide reductase [Candidatus Omnitrophota bacterium]
MDYDVIIIGGGPAGLTAALYNARARLKILIIEGFSVPAQAVITDCIENYPGFPNGISGFELIENFKKQVQRFGAEFSVGNVEEIYPCKDKNLNGWKIEVEGKTYTSLALIIACGARPKKMNVPGEEKLQGRGVSYCATCDGALYRDKDIVVIGGGDTAVEEALFLTRFGKKVTLVHRRDRLRAAKVLQERAISNKKMEFVWDSITSEIIGEDKVKAVKIKNIKTEKESIISCDGVFIFVGYTPNTDFVKELLKMDKNGYIVTDTGMKTQSPGIFACGDCRQKLLRQVVTACGDGAVAAFSAQQYVEELKGEAYK